MQVVEDLGLRIKYLIYTTSDLQYVLCILLKFRPFFIPVVCAHLWVLQGVESSPLSKIKPVKEQCPMTETELLYITQHASFLVITDYSSQINKLSIVLSSHHAGSCIVCKDCVITLMRVATCRSIAVHRYHDVLAVSLPLLKCNRRRETWI